MMKNFLKKAVGCTVVVAASFMLMPEAKAQQYPPLPMNPNVRYGRLDNGLTYYICHNELPEHHAEFYIAQRVGSVLEDENQRGLAHFLEHMAFNGTKNFPGKNMLDYLERNGVKFGTNVNAYTSIDETVYNISDVPTAVPGIVDSCLLMLHDWSGYISLEDDEIDNERGVIHEEWRSRNSPYLRMYEKTILPELLPGNRYGQRLPIGLMSVVDNFSYQALRDYYHKWYRPDLQGIMIVGDVNVDSVEMQIKSLWQDIKTPADAAERVWYHVDKNVEPLVSIATDKEATYNVLSVMYKDLDGCMPADVKLSAMGYLNDIAQNLISEMVNARYAEIAQQENAPFIQASLSFSTFLVAKTQDITDMTVVFKPGQWKEGLNAAMSVLNSVSQYGFTQGELDRMKSELSSKIENLYNERDKQKNAQIVNEMTSHFLDNEPMPGIEIEYQLFQQILPAITLDMINQAVQQIVTKENVAISMMAQEKEDNPIPAKEELLSAYNQSLEQEAKPYEETLASVDLITKMPKAGKIKKEKAGAFGTTIWTLSNGATVVFKQTDFKKDQILMRAYSPGGYKLLNKESKITKEMLGTVLSLGGLGQFSRVDLAKVLAGKRASVSANIDGSEEGLSGNCSPKDLKTMLELTYLNFTEIREDESAYKAFYSQMETYLKSYEHTPNAVLTDSMNSTLFVGDAEHQEVKLADLSGLDYKHTLAVAKERFSNAKDFTFVFVGNIDVDSLRQYVEQYIASLPAGKKVEKRAPADVFTPGSRVNVFDYEMSTPKTTVFNYFVTPAEWSIKESLTTAMLSQIMTIVYTETVREKEGGTYGVSVSGNARMSTPSINFIYVFETGEDKRARMEEVAYNGLVDMSENGPREADFKKVRDYLLKSFGEKVKENNYWMNVILDNVSFGYDGVSGYEEILNSITADDVKALAKRIVENQRIQVVAVGKPMAE